MRSTPTTQQTRQAQQNHLLKDPDMRTTTLHPIDHVDPTTKGEESEVRIATRKGKGPGIGETAHAITPGKETIENNQTENETDETVTEDNEENDLKTATTATAMAAVGNDNAMTAISTQEYRHHCQREMRKLRQSDGMCEAQ
jgi:hypothetical protein